MKSKDIGITKAFCPHCQKPFSRMPHTGDYQHDCFGSEVLANEDVLVLGDWTDYTGNDENVQRFLNSKVGDKPEFDPNDPGKTFMDARKLDELRRNKQI